MSETKYQRLCMLCGSKIRNLRKERKLTMEDVKRETGLSTRKQSAYESGACDMSFSVLSVYSEFYKVDLLEFLLLSSKTISFSEG